MRADPLSAVLSAWRAGRLPPGGALVIGFSGGPDSSALLHALAKAGKWHLLALHVDHAMRPASAADAAAAAEAARRMGAQARVMRLEHPPHGEEEARRARHAFLAAAAREIGAPVVALGHTADDQLETLLLRIVRGTGLRGLRGMGACEAGPAGVPVARPLLGLTRREVEAYLAAQGVTALQDPTNLDPAFADRNRLRLQAVPALRAINARVAEAAARLARVASDDDDALEAWATRELAALGRRSGSPSILPLRPFRALPVAIRRRILRQVAPDLSFGQVEQVLGLAAGQASGHTHLPGRRVAVRAAGRLEVCPEPAPDPARCRICLTQGGLAPSMEREFGNQQNPAES